jgi:hypothetical protein
VIDSLRGHIPPNALLGPRLIARTTAPGSRRREVIGGITVELLGLPHGGGRRNRAIEHLGYLVELGGRRLLHVGDDETERVAREVQAALPGAIAFTRSLDTRRW